MRNLPPPGPPGLTAHVWRDYPHPTRRAPVGGFYAVRNGPTLNLRRGEFFEGGRA